MTGFNSHLILKNNNDIELGKNIPNNYETKKKKEKKKESRHTHRVLYLTVNHFSPSYNAASFSAILGF